VKKEHTKMKKSELRQMIREEILKETGTDKNLLGGIDKGIRPKVAEKVFAAMAKQDKKYDKMNSS